MAFGLDKKGTTIDQMSGKSSTIGYFEVKVPDGESRETNNFIDYLT